MKLLNDLIASLRDSPVRDVRVGVTWTGVWSERCGVAKTCGVPVPHGCYTRDFGRLAEKTALELAEYSKSWNLIEASIGVAAINSLIEPKGRKGNAFDLIREVAAGKSIAIIGKFPSRYVSGLRSVARECVVLELNPELVNPTLGVLPATACEYLLPKSDMAVVTGSTLMNKSMERLLQLSKDAYTVVLGPSTPMSDILFDYGADVLAGTEVLKPEAVLRKISQSGGMLSERMYLGEVEFRILEK